MINRGIFLFSQQQGYLTFKILNPIRLEEPPDMRFLILNPKLKDENPVILDVLQSSDFNQDNPYNTIILKPIGKFQYSIQIPFSILNYNNEFLLVFNFRYKETITHKDGTTFDNIKNVYTQLKLIYMDTGIFSNLQKYIQYYITFKNPEIHDIGYYLQVHKILGNNFEQTMLSDTLDEFFQLDENTRIYMTQVPIKHVGTNNVLIIDEQIQYLDEVKTDFINQGDISELSSKTLFGSVNQIPIQDKITQKPKGFTLQQNLINVEIVRE